MEETRNRMGALTKMLKSRSLLLDSDEEDCVRMHDVVRDVFIFILLNKKHILVAMIALGFHLFMRQTGGEGTKLPTNLCLLYSSGNSKMEQKINKFNNSFVGGIRDLRVLFIENHSSLTSLPHTTHSLKNFITLVFNSCSGLETISYVGELVHLEILICHKCDSIKELLLEMKGLNRLKFLDLSWCQNLERIGGGIISSLVGLEELKMLWSFKKWEACDSKERDNANARLRELEALTNLTCLEIEIDDPTLATENLWLSSKLERFEIRIASLGWYNHSSQRGKKKLCLQWEENGCLGDSIHEKQLIRDIESLSLIGNCANNVDYMAKSSNIRWLELGNCETMKNIVITSMDDATVFPFIEHLDLSYLPELEEIFDGPISSNSFHNLKELQFKDLPALKQLWKSSSSPVLNNISSIYISRCSCLHNLGQFSVGGPNSSNLQL